MIRLLKKYRKWLVLFLTGLVSVVFSSMVFAQEVPVSTPDVESVNTVESVNAVESVNPIESVNSVERQQQQSQASDYLGFVNSHLERNFYDDSFAPNKTMRGF